MNEKKYKMILDWMRKIHQLEYAHRYQSLHYVKAERWLGISAFFITTVVSFCYRLPKIENDMYESLPFFLKQEYFIPIASTVAAVLTGLITFLRPSERAETHKKTGNNYEKIRHKIELVLTSKLTEDELDQKLNKIKEEWDNLDAINLSNRCFLKGKKKVNSFKKYPKELDFLEDITEN